MFIKLALVLLLALATRQTTEKETSLQVANFNITGFLVGLAYGFFDSIDFYEAWNCSQGIISFYNNMTVMVGELGKNSGGLQGTINLLNVIIAILNSTIYELTYCGSVFNEFKAIGLTFYYMFKSPHYIEDLGENLIRCSPFFLYYYEQVMRSAVTNSTNLGYYSVRGVFDTVLLTTYARQIGSTNPDNCDLEGFRHSVWSPK